MCDYFMKLTFTPSEGWRPEMERSWIIEQYKHLICIPHQCVCVYLHLSRSLSLSLSVPSCVVMTPSCVVMTPSCVVMALPVSS